MLSLMSGRPSRDGLQWRRDCSVQVRSSCRLGLGESHLSPARSYPHGGRPNYSQPGCS
jgi:hypothetical protein